MHVAARQCRLRSFPPPLQHSRRHPARSPTPERRAARFEPLLEFHRVCTAGTAGIPHASHRSPLGKIACSSVTAAAPDSLAGNRFALISRRRKILRQRVDRAPMPLARDPVWMVLSERLGRPWLIRGGLAIMAASSLGAAVAPGPVTLAIALSI